MKKEFLTSIESIRGIAVLLVFCAHTLQHWNSIFKADTAEIIYLYLFTFHFDFGKLGVYIFFLISGYLIPFHNRERNEVTAQHFLTRRFYRIVPLYLLSIPIGIYFEHMAFGSSFSANAVALNALLIPNFFSEPFALNVYWTLQIEMVFYLLIAIFLKRDLTREGSNLLIFLLVGSIICAELFRSLNRLTPEFYQFGELAKITGAISFIFLGSFIRKISNKTISKSELFIFSTYVFYLSVYWPIKNLIKLKIETGASAFSFLVPALAIFIFGYSIKLLRKRRIKPLEYLGMTSYSFYLFHSPAIYITKIFFASYFLEQAGNWINLLCFVIASFSLGLLFSHFGFKYIEERFRIR
jgi:peptidoglycan/LPS O-acetylase OafA/YrhL